MGSRWGLALVKRAFRLAYTNMLVSKKPRRPNANPPQKQRKPNGPYLNPNTSRWNMVHVEHARVGFALGMSISCCLSHYRLRKVANANVVSAGIWAFFCVFFCGLHG